MKRIETTVFFKWLNCPVFQHLLIQRLTDKLEKVQYAGMPMFLGVVNLYTFIIGLDKCRLVSSLVDDTPSALGDGGSNPCGYPK